MSLNVLPCRYACVCVVIRGGACLRGLDGHGFGHGHEHEHGHEHGHGHGFGHEHEHGHGHGHGFGHGHGHGRWHVGQLGGDRATKRLREIERQGHGMQPGRTWHVCMNMACRRAGRRLREIGGDREEIAREIEGQGHGM